MPHMQRLFKEQDMLCRNDEIAERIPNILLVHCELLN